MNVHDDLSSLHSALSEFRKMAMFEAYEITGPESHGMDRDTPLHIAAMDGRLDLLRIFLPFVKNINIQGDIGNTPLHYAVMWNHPEVVRLLLKNKADINFKNDYGDTPVGLMKDRPCFENIIMEQSI